jgi:hypothetical protein
MIKQKARETVLKQRESIEKEEHANKKDNNNLNKEVILIEVQSVGRIL